MKSTITFYLTLLLRRLHWIVIIFAIFAAGSITIAGLLPPVYRSGSSLLVEPPQIPQNLASSTVQSNPQEEMQIIQQRLMTRVNLIDIARSENVFTDIGEMTLDDIEQGMRDATRINVNIRTGQPTIMRIQFESDRAAVAANVVNRYVTIVLQENVANRTKQAGDTLDFFEGEVARLTDELSRKSAEILEFNNSNADALPSTLNFRMSQQATLQARVDTLERDIANLEDQKQRLIDMFQQTGTVGTAQTAPTTPAQAKLAQLEQQLSDALAIYSESNPNITLLRSKIAQQTKIVQDQMGATPAQGGTTTTTNNSILDVQIAGIDAQIETNKSDLANTTTMLEAINETIDRTPGVQIKLDALNRDYANIQTQYNRAVSGLASAATGERIELLAQGQRITVIDPATVPSRPAKPNRVMIAGGGSVFGLMLGVFFALGLAMLNPSIRRPVEITSKLGITPLATIPYVRTPMEMVARRAMITAALVAVVIGLPAILYTIHTYYLPLDLIYEKIASRISSIL